MNILSVKSFFSSKKGKIIFGAVSGILLCLVNCIITLSISKISANYLYRKKTNNIGCYKIKY